MSSNADLRGAAEDPVVPRAAIARAISIDSTSLRASLTLSPKVGGHATIAHARDRGVQPPELTAGYFFCRAAVTGFPGRSLTRIS
jgi:hypothetical protein